MLQCLTQGLNLKHFTLQIRSTANARMMYIKECEEYLLKSSSAGPSDQPQPKHSKQDKSSTLWSIFDKLLAENEEDSEGYGCKIQQKLWLKCI